VPLGSLKNFYSFNLGTLLSLLATTGMAATVCSDTDAGALEWLDKMSKSMRQVSYQGVVTLQRDDDLQSMQVSHLVDHGNSSERLTELTGQGAQVERGAHSLECLHPGDKLLRLGERLEEDRCGIAEQYRFSVVEGGERVAGRKAVRINIEPRDMYRFGYAMSLDRETGLLLKSQTISHGHKTLETTQFAQISFTEGVPAASDVDVVHEAQHPTSARPTVNSAATRGWTVRWIPRGFAATESSLGINGRRTYTDGLAVFSVFLENLDLEMRPGEGQVTQGGTTTYTRGMFLAGQPVLVTVIGEVPVNTARMVADSVAWVQ
jgi:sigma-E factor negative regulatory protein RseB